jgi:peptide alpha-N-acetyltransferase
MSAQPFPPPGSTLPPSLRREFHEVIRLYDLRSWRPCLKAADKLLRAVKEPHGETLAFKGMALYYLNRKAEGMQCVKDGLRASQLRSPITWWLMGVMHRANQATGEAAKAYRNALRLEPDNTNALRDLASAQCHSFEFSGAAETRAALLRARPSAYHMAGLAVVHALAGALDMAGEVCSDLQRLLEGGAVPGLRPLQAPWPWPVRKARG